MVKPLLEKLNRRPGERARELMLITTLMLIIIASWVTEVIGTLLSVMLSILFHFNVQNRNSRHFWRIYNGGNYSERGDFRTLLRREDRGVCGGPPFAPLLYLLRTAYRTWLFEYLGMQNTSVSILSYILM